MKAMHNDKLDASYQTKMEAMEENQERKQYSTKTSIPKKLNTAGEKMQGFRQEVKAQTKETIEEKRLGE